MQINQQQDFIKDKSIEKLEKRIKQNLEKHLKEIGLDITKNNKVSNINVNKEQIRNNHYSQKEEKNKQSKTFLEKNYNSLLRHFASGKDVNPNKIIPRITVVKPNSLEARLFRLSTLTWSIPVSEGYGRRMRFVVWDDNNDKIIGIIALGDPVFNLKARDSFIGWSVAQRKEQLVNIMNAYVLGALPPYNMLLCGKLIACLIRTIEIKEYFNNKYNNMVGIISKKKKNPNLVLVSTTSALGKSSVYNRLKLNGKKYFEPIGYTSGYGHFQIPSEIFNDMREYLNLKNHKYYSDNSFGEGPNWKYRAIKVSLGLLGLNYNFLLHGIKREVFISRLASNAEQVLMDGNIKPEYNDLMSAEEVGRIAIERWVIPRSLKREYCNWQKENIYNLICSSKN